jgi:hypothetical protein
MPKKEIRVPVEKATNWILRAKSKPDARAAAKQPKATQRGRKVGTNISTIRRIKPAMIQICHISIYFFDFY